MYQKVHKNIFLRFLFSFISFLLIFLLIMNSSIICCFAVAGVDDALLLLLVAIMGACGITFSSTLLANQAADALYDSSPPDLQKILDAKASELVVLGAFGSAGITFLAEQWTQITQSVINTFGDFTGIDVAFDATNTLDNAILSLNNSLRVKCGYHTTSSSYIVNVNNFIFEYYGRNNKAFSNLDSAIIEDMTVRCSNKFPDVHLLRIGDFTFTRYINSSNTASSVFTSILGFHIAYSSVVGLLFNATSNIGAGAWSNVFYQGELVTFNYTSENSYNSFRLSTSICADIGTSLGLSDSICPDGIFTRETFTNWLVDIGNNDIGGVGALPGAPGIDTTAYPRNDTWHDGIDDVGSVPGSIGIAVPGDINDVIDYSPDLARDVSNVDVSDSDIADTDTDTSDKTDTDNDTPSITKPGGLPAMSLPEVLFKEKFPFCLPWDLYNVFVILNAEPVAPKFDIPFKFERFGIDYVFTIDLSDYEQFALISRASLSITFVIALILLSRKVIGAE